MNAIQIKIIFVNFKLYIKMKDITFIKKIRSLIKLINNFFNE